MVHYIKILKEYASQEDLAVCCTDAGNIKSSQKCSFQFKWYQTVSLSVHMYHHGCHRTVLCGI